MKLADVKEKFGEFIVIKDPWILEIVLATCIGNMLMDRDPIWTIIVGPSSGGKTTLLAPCNGLPRTYFIDDLTEKTLLSGFKVKGKEMSLLRQIGSGMMIFSDFTSILAKNPMSRGEILTQLKLVYDGKITKYTGTGGIPWEGKIGTLCASTPDIYSALENSRSMGERFLYYWFEQPSNAEIMAKQQDVVASAKEIADTMQEYYTAYYNGVQTFIDTAKSLPYRISKEQAARVHAAAQFCVNGKATIHTDFKTGKPDAIPNISGVGRDSKIFDTLLHTLQVMNAYETGMVDAAVTDEMVSIVEKCAYSSVNRERRKILEILVSKGTDLSASQIGAEEGLGLEKESVEKYLAPLHAVGIIKKKTLSNRHTWFVDDPETIAFIERVSKTVPDKSPVPAISISEGALLEEYEEDVAMGVYKPEEEELWNSVPDSPVTED